MSPRILPPFAALLLLGGCAAYDRATNSDTSGIYPQNRATGPANPAGTTPERAVDRTLGTNTSGAYPQNGSGSGPSKPGTAVDRAYDRATGQNTSGAYPQNQKSY